MKLQSLYFISGLALIHPFSQSFAGALDDLSLADRNQVLVSLSKDQKPVSIRVKVDYEQALWPEFHVFEKVKATPEEAAAVFADFENHKKYFGSLNITQSHVVSGLGTSVEEIDYYLNVFLASDDYRCRDQISYDPAHGSYQVNWDVIQSSQSYIKGEIPQVWSHGNAHFESFAGGTLIAYTNLVMPKNSLASSGWIIDRGESTVMQTVHLLVQQIEKEHNTPQLEAQKAALKVDLAH